MKIQFKYQTSSNHYLTINNQNTSLSPLDKQLFSLKYSTGKLVIMCNRLKQSSAYVWQACGSQGIIISKISQNSKVPFKVEQAVRPRRHITIIDMSDLTGNVKFIQDSSSSSHVRSNFFCIFSLLTRRMDVQSVCFRKS